MNLGKPLTIELEGYSAVSKPIVQSGNSGRLYVPLTWLGKQVCVILIAKQSSSPTKLSDIPLTSTSRKIRTAGHEVVQKIPVMGGHSARIYVPHHWIGGTAYAVLVQK